MIALHIRKDPDIPRILAQWMTRVFATFGPLIRLLPWIFLRDSNRIQAKVVAITLRIPKNGLVPARESVAAIEPMFEVPNNPVPEFESLVCGKYGVKCQVQRND